MAATCLLLLFNTIHLLFSLALAGTSIWLFIELQNIIALRNENQHLLDFNVHWAQAAPWVFVLVAAFILCVSCCGFIGAKTRSRGYILTYIVFEVIAILALIVAAILGLNFVDCEATDKFMKSTIVEGFENSKSNAYVKTEFEKMEHRMHCCGADGVTDYSTVDYTTDSLPLSCCDDISLEWVGKAPKCNKNNQSVRLRHGCVKVAAKYTRLFVRSLSYASGFTAAVGIISVVLAVFLFRGISKRPLSEYTDSMDTLKK